MRRRRARRRRWRGNFGQSDYVAAKAGVVGFTRGFALESAKHGVTANITGVVLDVDGGIGIGSSIR